MTVFDVPVYVHHGRNQFPSLVQFAHIITALHQIRVRGTSQMARILQHLRQYLI